MSATSHYKTRQYQESLKHAHSNTVAKNMNDGGRLGDSGGWRASSGELAASLASKSMALLQTHQRPSSSKQALHEEEADGQGRGNTLFQDDFLNSNPILLEYMAQAALEGLDDDDSADGVALHQADSSDTHPTHHFDELHDHDHHAHSPLHQPDDHINFIDVPSQHGTTHGAGHVGEGEDGVKKKKKNTNKPDISLCTLALAGASVADGKQGLEEEEACLSRSETSRPASRAQTGRCRERCRGFAAELRQVASTMSGMPPLSLCPPATAS